MKDTIVHKAIAELNNLPDIEGTWAEEVDTNLAANNVFEIDGIVTIRIKDDEFRFFADVKREIRNHQLPDIYKRANEYENLIIIAQYIYPKIKEQLREKNIAYLDTYGNAYIRTNTNLIWLEHGRKPDKEKNIRNRAFTKTGIKVLFLYLHNDEWVNLPYRTIANMAGVALGTIPPVIDALKQLGYLINIDEKRYQLVNKEELLNKWAEAYGEKLKPALKIGNFFAKTLDKDNWKNFQFNDYTMNWGGEPAADLLTNYLKPDKLTIYTTKTTKELMIDYNFYPDENGQTAIFRKFWEIPHELPHTVPPVLIYADLINTNDSRCIETAKMIFNEYIR